MSNLDLSRLFQAHFVLSSIASLHKAPVWNPALALAGLVLVPRLDTDPAAAESASQLVTAIGASVLFDFCWFVSHKSHGLSRVCTLVNWLLKLVTLLNLSSQLQSRGHAGGFTLPGGGPAGGFTLPGGLGERFASVFPAAGGFQHQQPSAAAHSAGRDTSETVWTAPGSYQQTRFSLDEEGSIDSMTPPVAVSGAQSPLGGDSKSKAGPAGGNGGGGHGGSGAEGGGYHTLE